MTMHMESFDINRYKSILNALEAWKRVAFMACCCERMLPNYSKFNLESGFGDPETLNHALAIVWNWIESDQMQCKIGTLALKCEQQGPNTADFPSLFTSAALDAANAIASTLEAIGDANVYRAIEVASLARDTVDLFVQQIDNLDPNSIDFERRILEHQYMQDELRNQRIALEKLGSLPSDRRLVVRLFHAECASRGGSLPCG